MYISIYLKYGSHYLHYKYLFLEMKLRCLYFNRDTCISNRDVSFQIQIPLLNLNIHTSYFSHAVIIRMNTSHFGMCEIYV